MELRVQSISTSSFVLHQSTAPTYSTRRRRRRWGGEESHHYHRNVSLSRAQTESPAYIPSIWYLYFILYRNSLLLLLLLLLRLLLMYWYSSIAAAASASTIELTRLTFPRHRSSRVFSFYARGERQRTTSGSSPIISRKQFLVRNCCSATTHLSLWWVWPKIERN